MRHDLVASVLEGAISAEMALFTIFLLTNRKRTAALFLLAALSGALAAMVAFNLLGADTGWPGLADLVLVLDLLSPAMFYLYVRYVHLPTKAPRMADLVHALPAIIGFSAWKLGVLPSMDAYVIACWSIFLAASILQFARGYRGYAPAPLRRFIVLFMGMLAIVVALRMVMSVQASEGVSFRDSLAYTLTLVLLFLLTFQLLFTSLHYPGVLTSPGAYIKYAHVRAPSPEHSGLEQRLAALMRDGKPFLNPDITLAELSVMLDAPARQVSQLINARFSLNVPAYLNQCRVKEAARILRSEPGKPVKVVMFEAGFTSKAIFHREFQRNFGTSPTVFRRDQLGN